ncbi:MAG: Tex-like N-terminal domain-containing protein [Flavobacteriales bacterium]|jgi:protein Tex|nr:Tex-like N-terminal domain-containing protein [Flavobacteriales bacterium]
MSLPFHLISEKTGLNLDQVEAVSALLKEGATLPFIARYRKDQTGGVDEIGIEFISDQINLFEKIAVRKNNILKLLKKRKVIDAKLILNISSSWNLTEIEDLFLPFKQQKENKATLAINSGLDGLAKIILSQKEIVSKRQILSFKCESYSNEVLIMDGVIEILIKWIVERKQIRHLLRQEISRNGLLMSKVKKSSKDEEGAEKYKDYIDYSEALSKIKSHRFMAVQRGANEGFLTVSLKLDKKKVIDIISSKVISDQGSLTILSKAIELAWSKSLKPSMRKEIFNKLKEKSDHKAIAVFSDNLRQLLMQPPLRDKRILAIDPGFKSGCKLVCLSDKGDLLNNATIYPHPPQNLFGEAKKKIAGLIEQYKLDGIAIGNGTASRETERLIKGTRFNRKVNVYVVNEAGASVYSASSIARKEFPDFDVTVRGAISIGRRLIDPLAELVKIDPKSIGVGQYQHDVDQALLSKKLNNVVVSAVNNVGVDLNTASEYLLEHVSGIGKKISENIVKYRKEHGSFNSREELKNVPKLGAKCFEQSAGFLRVKNGLNPLDDSAVHPDYYNIINKICVKEKVKIEDLIGNTLRVEAINWEQHLSSTLGFQTINDIKSELIKPGLDPRKIIYQLEFDPTIRTINDLSIGQILPGIVNNVTNFGAFVDIGIKENGLIHISHLADEYIENPSDFIKVHQHVKAKVVSVDVERKRIGLSLKGI